MSLIRPWRAGDLASLVENANNRNVWINLRDRFPHPYRQADGKAWLAYATSLEPVTDFAIETKDGTAVGGVGVELGRDIERVSGEIGYWLGERHWGQGLGTAAAREITSYAFSALLVERVFAVPFVRNAASIALLGKLGFRCEGELVGSAIKDGRLENQRIYAITRAEWRP
jgi:RimJ/RimL family protein N-acetyltransferase